MYKTFTYSELEEMDLSKNELAIFMGIKNSFDTALPEQWLQMFCEKTKLSRNQVLYSCFMVYNDEWKFGQVFSAWDKCQVEINKGVYFHHIDKLSDEIADKIEKKMVKLFGLKENRQRVDQLSIELDTIVNELFIPSIESKQ